MQRYKRTSRFPFCDEEVCEVSCEVVSLSSFACSEFLLLTSFYSENLLYNILNEKTVGGSPIVLCRNSQEICRHSLEFLCVSAE